MREDAATKRQTGTSAKGAVRTCLAHGSKPGTGVQDCIGYEIMN